MMADLKDKGEITEGKSLRSNSRYSLRSRPSPKDRGLDQSVNKFFLYEDGDYDYLDDHGTSGRKRRNKKAKGGKFLGKRQVPRKQRITASSFENSEDEEYHPLPGEHYYDQIILSKLPKTTKKLEAFRKELVEKLDDLKFSYLQEIEQNKNTNSSIPVNAVPINADVTKFDFLRLQQSQLKFGGRLFDVIMMDPPWQLSTSQPSRGVAIGYSSLADDCISRLPIPSLQTAGFLFVWVINAKYSYTCSLMKQWGYKLVDEIVWIKKTINGKIAKGHGYYLQHAKETCLVGVKNENLIQFERNVGSDVIFSERRGQSQKPNEIYELIEKMVPNGFYLEIFGRRNNLRDRWVTVGNEL